MKETWNPDAPGVLRLPSGRLVRGRGLARPLPEGPTPDFALYLLGKEPPAVAWESEWIRWPDFRLPSDKPAFVTALRTAWARAETERVEFACHGGHGRTGTALACLAVLDGVPAPEAVAYVRANYAPKAVETPWQSRFVTRFTGCAARLISGSRTFAPRHSERMQTQAGPDLQVRPRPKGRCR